MYIYICREREREYAHAPARLVRHVVGVARVGVRDAVRQRSPRPRRRSLAGGAQARSRARDKESLQGWSRTFVSTSKADLLFGVFLFRRCLFQSEVRK